MKQEDKKLLLKDLCARLPYGVKICYIYNGEECVSTIEKIDTFGYIWDNYNGCYHVKEIKPYLFPFSSMTEELREELEKLYWNCDGYEISNDVEYVYHNDCFRLIEWLNKNHFDYSGLIEKGLAIDCTNLNIY